MGITFTVGIGFTVIVNILELEHPLKVAVTFILAVIGTPVAFVATKEGIGLELPLAPSPIDVLLFVQVNVAPGTLVKLRGPTVAPAQTIILAGTTGDGVTLTVTGIEVVVVPHSLVTDNVIVYVPGVE